MTARGPRKDHYRRIAGVYDALLERVTHGLRTRGLSLAPPREGMAVLDVGCGTGLHLRLYRGSGCRVHGADSSEAMLGVARRNLGEAADLCLCDASALPFRDRSFDLITSMLMLHEIDPETRRAAAVEMVRVLKPGGRILLIDYRPGRPDSPLGWLVRAATFLMERAAGGGHFRNYQGFMASGGVETLAAENSLLVEVQEPAAGGALALTLLSPRSM